MHFGYTNFYESNVSLPYPTDIYLLKVNNKNTRARCEIWSKWTKRGTWTTSLLLLWTYFLHLRLVFLLLPLNMWLSGGNIIYSFVIRLNQVLSLNTDRWGNSKLSHHSLNWWISASLELTCYSIVVSRCIFCRPNSPSLNKLLMLGNCIYLLK